MICFDFSLFYSFIKGKIISVQWILCKLPLRQKHMQKQKQLFGKTCLPFHFFSYRFVQYGMTNELGEVQISVTQFSCWWSSKRGHHRSQKHDLVNLFSSSPTPKKWGQSFKKNRPFWYEKSMSNTYWPLFYEVIVE